jgi:hypothetical protein
MGKLEVIFKIRLAYPLLRMGTAGPPAVVHFPDTGNTVRLEAPMYGPPTAQPVLEGFDQMTLHVERECTDEQGRDTSDNNFDRLRINQDAARGFWQLFEAIREAALRQDNVVFMFPVVPSEEIRSNPLVKGCESQWIYEGNCLEHAKIGKGIPTIEITDDRWAAAVKRLGEGKPVPVYTRFALDAVYFAEHDPPRGIVMACAAWETALRYYLATVASKRDPAYLIASEGGNIPRLYEFAIAARGGPLFFDWIDKTAGFERELLESHRQQMGKLGKMRNRLLHEGETTLPELAATNCAAAVLSAIEWLFAVT